MRYGPVRDGRKRWVLGLARLGLIALLAPLVAAGCGKKSPTTTQSSSPPSITTPTTPAVTVTTTSPSPAPTLTPSPSAKPSPTPTTTTVVPPVTATVQINAASGSSMTAKVNQILSLTLGQDSGAAWNFVTLPNNGVLAVVNQQSFLPTPAPSGVTEEFRVTFKAISAGTTGFALNESVGSAPPTMAYSVTITVTS
ncbi:MAG TPA: hypothetical protein VKY26_00670 [Actinomycetota bacterium]|nr:hypothetical protein [Actinomycetota bacterium]